MEIQKLAKAVRGDLALILIAGVVGFATVGLVAYLFRP
jgi:hypothetical protein